MCQWRAGGEMPQYEEKAETSPDSERRRLCGAWRVLGRRMGVLRGWCWGVALQIFFLALLSQALVSATGLSCVLC